MEQQRQLGLGAAIAVVTGESIALGIFLTPAAMARSLGSPLLLGLVWLAMALMAMCGALCYSALAIRFPKSGGEYVYLRAGYGDTVAFLYGWMSTIVMYPGVAAALAVGSVAYVVQVAPLNPAATALVAPMLLCIFCVVNLAGTRLSGAVISLVNFLKLAILFGLVAWAALSGHAHWTNLTPLTARRSNSETATRIFAEYCGMSAAMRENGCEQPQIAAPTPRRKRRTASAAPRPRRRPRASNQATNGSRRTERKRAHTSGIRTAEPTANLQSMISRTATNATKLNVWRKSSANQSEKALRICSISLMTADITRPVAC